MSLPDRGYTILLSHLHRADTPLPLPTLQAALSHHLANISPLPTPLAAISVSSPFFLTHPFTHLKLQVLSTAFRHATHLKYTALKDSSKQSGGVVSALFKRSIATQVGQWVVAAVKGVQGGHPVLRVACCTGLVMGLEDLRVKVDVEAGIGEKGRSSVEGELVVALAEVMDVYGSGFGRVTEEWEKEFQVDDQVDVLSLALVLASQSLPLVDQQKLKALPLAVLAQLLTSTISSSFQHGTFLSTLSTSVVSSPTGTISIPPTSPLSQTLQTISSSPLTAAIASLSKLTSLTLALLLDSSHSHSRRYEALNAVRDTLAILKEMASRVENNWKVSPLASISEEEHIAADSRVTTKSIWTILKTMLFSTVMIADACLSSVVYVPPSATVPFTDTNSSNTASLSPTPTSVALITLQTLSHLSFVISQFGGVTSQGHGFGELKKTFYLAVDVLVQERDGVRDDAEQGEGERFVKELVGDLTAGEGNGAVPKLFQEAKKAYAFASIEQLVPVLGEACIWGDVVPLCIPHLSNPTHRETYESAHSVVLSVFAAHAQRHALQQQQHLSAHTVTGFVDRMVPFYVGCLIDNTEDGKLNIAQLRLAYSALVRGASASASNPSAGTAKGDEGDGERYALAWYCINLVLEKIRELPPTPDEAERLHRLHLMLISAVSSLPLPLLMKVLGDVKVVILGLSLGSANEKEEKGAQRREELVKALFMEILEKVGDREKEAAMRWWYANREELSGALEKRQAVVSGERRNEDEQGQIVGARL